MSIRRKLTLLACAAVFTFAGALFLGARFLNPAAFASSHPLHALAELRFMRTICALLTGASLSLSGLFLQTVLKNPLAEPFTLGISGGAGVGAVMAFVLGVHTVPYAIQGFALAGALATLGAVLLLSRGGGRGSESLLLSGIIAGTIASSVLLYCLSIASSDQVAGASWWMLGDLRCNDVVMLWCSAGLLTCGGVFGFLFARDLDLLSLGADEAFYAGVNPRILSVAAVVAASLLASFSVAVCGIISFCGLIVPHLVRRLFGCGHRCAVPAAMLGGGTFLMLCDLLSRSFSAEQEIPPGVITAFLGGGLFLVIISRKGARQNGGK